MEIIRKRNQSAPPTQGELPTGTLAHSPVATRTWLPDRTTNSYQVATYKTAHFAAVDFNYLRIGFPNYVLREADTPNAIFVKATLVYDGETYPIYFANNIRTASIKRGMTLFSLPLNVPIPKDAMFHIYTCVSVASLGQYYPTTTHLTMDLDEGFALGDQTDSLEVEPSSTHLAYRPCALIGMTEDISTPKLAVIGDSIFNHYNDNSYGIAYRGIGNRYPYLNLAIPAERAASFIQQSDNKKRMDLIASSGITHVICNYGVNDLADLITFDSLKAAYLNIWGWLDSIGIKVIQCTIMPRTVGGFATPEQQTYANSASSNSPTSTIRLINDYIRTGPAPLHGFIDLMTFVESSSDSCKWRAGLTSDGTHPNVSGGIEIGNYIYSVLPPLLT